MTTAVAPVQVGIFTNDLCIGYRIIMHELLDTHVYRVFESAKDIHRQRPQDSFRAMYERGMRSINAWDTQLKERYRAQVIAQYRQLTDLYHHIYLMYVQEMYDQSLDDVTVRVNIPALATMLHFFLRLACNHQVILSGEYVTTMNFSGRVLFVETIIRRLLYELLVQQNNIKSISTATAKPRRSGTAALSVHSEEDMLSADMMMGTQRQPTPRLSPTADADRFWMAPNSVSEQNSSILSQLSNSGNAIVGPRYQPRPPRNLVPSFVAPPAPPIAPQAPPVVPPAPPVVPAASSATPSVAPSATLSSVAAAISVPESILATFVSPIPAAASEVSASVVIPPNNTDTVLTGALAPEPAKLVASTVPRITSLPNQPIISGSVAAGSALFELKSQFTPFKPGGTSFPEAQIASENRKDIDVDSLQLQPSDQDFAEEARRLLQDNGTDTITPFDSVTNIANGDRRPPLFFDAVHATQ